MRILLLITALFIVIQSNAQQGIRVTYGITETKTKKVDSLPNPMLMLEGLLSEIEYTMGCSGDMQFIKVGMLKDELGMSMFIDFKDSIVYGNVSGIKFQSSYNLVDLGMNPHAIKDSSIRYFPEEQKEIMGIPVFKAEISMQYKKSPLDKRITAWVTDEIPCQHLLFMEEHELNYLDYVPLEFTIQTETYSYTVQAIDLKMEAPTELVRFDKSEYEMKDKDMIKNLWKGKGKEEKEKTNED
jgi:GLPGLI family protein